MLQEKYNESEQSNALLEQEVISSLIMSSPFLRESWVIASVNDEINSLKWKIKKQYLLLIHRR